jgi:hypothetical protein
MSPPEEVLTASAIRIVVRRAIPADFIVISFHLVCSGVYITTSMPLLPNAFHFPGILNEGCI